MNVTENPIAMKRRGFAGKRRRRPSLAGTLASDMLLLGRMLFARDRQARQQAASVILLGDGKGRKAHSKLLVRIAVFVMALSSARVAMAQTFEGTTVPATVFDAERGEGVRVTPSFVLHPSVSGRVTYDSNIYNVDTGTRSDAVFNVQPRLELQSDFPRHALILRAGADINRYASVTAENSEAWDASAAGRLELGGRIDVVPEVGIARQIDKRGTAGEQFATDRPISSRSRFAQIAISRTQGKIELVVNGRVAKREYDAAEIGGVPISLADRDVVTRFASVQARLRFSPALKGFVEVGGNEVNYSLAASRFRNSSGYTVLAGTQLQITNLVELEAGAGYVRQNFESALFKPVSGLDYRLTARWTPRPTWLVTAAVQRNVDASPRQDAPAILRSEYRLSTQHAFSDRLIGEGRVAYMTEEYRGIDRTDRNFRVGASVQYRLLPRVGLTAEAEYRNQQGGVLGRTFKGAYVAAGVRFVL